MAKRGKFATFWVKIGVRFSLFGNLKVQTWPAMTVNSISSNILLKASTEVAQLEVICKSCGVPDVTDWPEITRLKHFKTMVHPLVGRFHPKPRRQIREMFCALPPDSIDVLDDLLRLNPSKRLTSQKAIQGSNLNFVPWIKTYP